MKILQLLVLIIGIAIPCQAQTFEVSGKVTSANDGQPLPGVNVIIKGSTNGTQTNFDGIYKLAAQKGDSLVFSYIGFKTLTIGIGDAKVYNAILEEDHAALEEVVISAYSVSNRNASILTNASSQSIAQRLSGKAPGVTIRGASSINGSATNISIRKNTDVKSNDDVGNTLYDSTSSIDTQPIYIVDGVAIDPIYNSIVSNLDESVIDSKNEYNPRKAQRIFGQIGNRGCVVITTVHGNYRIENDESYARISENRFNRTQLYPLSTFSIDVDKAAYSNIRRMLNNGQSVPIDAVRIEEMINYFNYNYPQPNNEHPFSINTEVCKTPWNEDTRLVKIGLQGKTYENDHLPAANLTFLIDVSGSMNSLNKLSLLKSAFSLLVNQLRAKDKIAIVVYAGAAGLVLPPTSGKNKEKIIEALNKLEAGGSTAGGQGIELAYKVAEEHFETNKINRVILATDGDFNVGKSSDSDMEKLIETKRKSGIFLSVLGFGYGNLKDSKLETLADKGNGNHAYIDTMQEAQKVFGKEFGGTLYTIAKDVKIQVEFNPALVQGYRLIGYENRMLTAQDFRDDTKDAGELGSGHSVTALYEIIPQGINSPYLKEVDSLRYSNLGNNLTENDELFTVRFRYKKPDEDKSKEIIHVQPNKLKDPSQDFKFASAVALFGMQLRHSQYLNGTGETLILSLAKDGKGVDEAGYRSEFIRLVESNLKI